MSEYIPAGIFDYELQEIMAVIDKPYTDGEPLKDIIKLACLVRDRQILGIEQELSDE